MQAQALAKPGPVLARSCIHCRDPMAQGISHMHEVLLAHIRHIQAEELGARGSEGHPVELCEVAALTQSTWSVDWALELLQVTRRLTCS